MSSSLPFIGYRWLGFRRGGVKGMRVLLVEDNDDDALLIESLSGTARWRSIALTAFDSVGTADVGGGLDASLIGSFASRRSGTGYDPFRLRREAVAVPIVVLIGPER